MTCGIYKITNLVNQKSYIGQSIHIEQRWEEEKEAAYNPKNKTYGYPLSCAFRKYGISNFSFQILEQCEREQLNKQEKYWIEYYNSYFEGYNQTLGGDSVIHMCKLTFEEAEEIIQYLLLASKNKQYIYFTELGKKYNISRDIIQGINCGRYWYNSKYAEKYPLYISPFTGKAQDFSNYCIRCGKKITKGASYCKNCLSIPLIGKEQILSLLIKNNGNFTQTASILHTKPQTLRAWCQKYDLSPYSKDYKEIKEKDTSHMPVQIDQYDKENNYIQSFSSIREGARWICENGQSSSTPSSVSTKISEVCNNKRKTAFGYIWRKSNL